MLPCDAEWETRVTVRSPIETSDIAAVPLSMSDSSRPRGSLVAANDLRVLNCALSPSHRGSSRCPSDESLLERPRYQPHRGCWGYVRGTWNGVQECVRRVLLLSRTLWWGIASAPVEYWWCTAAFVAHSAERILFPLVLKQNRPWVLMQLTILVLFVHFLGVSRWNASRFDFRFSPIVIPLAFLDTCRLLLVFLSGGYVEPFTTVLLLQLSIPMMALYNAKRMESCHAASCGTILLGMMMLIGMSNKLPFMLAYSLSILPQFFGTLLKQWWLTKTRQTYVSFNLTCLLCQFAWGTVVPLWDELRQSWSLAEVLTVCGWLASQVVSSQCFARTIQLAGEMACANVVCASTLFAGLVLMPSDPTSIISSILVLLGVVLFNARPL